MDDTRTLSVVVAIYNEEDNLPDLCRRLQTTFATMPDIASKVIYVNDGSTDGSLQIMLEQHAQDARFTVVDLSRNFGHQPAITAGLMAADTDAVVMMDGDLQDPPELIPKLVETWRQGAEVVLAVRSQRAERGVRRVGFEMFYRIMNWMSDFPIPDRVGIFGLIDRRALNELNRLPERNRYLPGLRAWVGFDQRVVTYERCEREAGAPKQTLWHLVRYAVDAFLSFSYKPLRLMLAAGVLVSLSAFVLAIVFVVRRLTGYEPAPTGFTTLVTLLLFLGGVQLIAIGLLGEYLGRIYEEVKRRPLYIVKHRYTEPETPVAEANGWSDA
jgi:glycosyltransferase involved in cell wall biosynthesis